MRANHASPTPSRIRRRRAVILILSLWIAMILSMMAFSVAYELRLNLRLTKQSQDVLKARALARAGLAKAVMDLRNDKLLAMADPAQMLTDSHKDVWYLNEDKTDIELGEGTYTVRIEDEEGKFNINDLNQRNAPVLGHILTKLLGLDPVVGNQMAFMIMDFQDPDSVPGLGQGTYEEEYYTEWGRDKLGRYTTGDWKFEAKNDLVLALEELLVLPGITHELLFGDPVEDHPRRPRRRDRDESPVLSDYITVQAGHHLNLNTVSILTLEGLLKSALPASLGAEAFATKIYEYRINLAKTEGTRGTITSITQLEDPAVGLPRREIGLLNSLIPLNVASSHYTITSRGEYKGISKTIRVRVEVKVESFQIDAKRPDSYGRRDRRASGSLRRSLNHVIDPAVRVLQMTEI